MFRTTLLLAAFCLLAACDKRSTPTAPQAVDSTATGPGTGTPLTQTVHGILRRTMIDSVEVQWDLELATGTFYRLIGGPVETYDALLDTQVLVVGVVQDDGSISVQTCEADTQIYDATRNRAKR